MTLLLLVAACATPCEDCDSDGFDTADTAGGGDSGDTADGDPCATPVVTFEGADGARQDLSGPLTTGEYVTLDVPGTLRVCPGVWYAHVLVRAEVQVVGLGSSPDQVVLSGGESGTVLDVLGPAGALQVQGVTLDRGAGLQVEHNSGGGGLYCEGAGVVLAEDVRFTRNTANDGAALYAQDCTVTVRRAEFLDNVSEDDGGAFTLWYGSATLEDVTFTGNQALDGGALALFYAQATVSGAHFEANAASHFAGAIWVYESTLELSDSVLLDNHNPVEDGGGVLLAGAARLERVRIQGNEAPQGGGIFLYWESTLEAVDVDLLGNTADDLFVADYVHDEGGLALAGREGWSFSCAANACVDTE